MNVSRFFPRLSLLAFWGVSTFAGEAPAPPAPAPAAVPAAVKTPAAAPAGKTPPLSPRFRQVRDRIDALFQHRNAALPPLDPSLDPFRPPGAVPAPSSVKISDSDGAKVPVVGPSSDVRLLQDAAATLKVSGIFEIGGKQHLVINSRPYKEGDVIQTQVQGNTVYLRVRQISRNSMVLVLNQAELAVKF